jgi:2'-5' RNA ligase
VYSLNVPVPGEVAALATDLARELPGARPRERGRHTLVCKRLGGGDRVQFRRLAARAREVLSGTAPFAARVTGVGSFPDPPTGTAPVVYLAVDSPGLERLHARLAERFDPVERLEGEAYVPHVTIARGGRLADAERLAAREIDPVTWTVTELRFWDADRGPADRVSLPA